MKKVLYQATGKPNEAAKVTEQHILNIIKYMCEKYEHASDDGIATLTQNHIKFYALNN